MNSAFKVAIEVPSPDQNAAGFLSCAPDPLRYDGHRLGPQTVGGIVVSMVSRGARVLDVGSGTGSLARILKDTCQAEVIGVEPDRDRADRARARGLEIHWGYLSPALIGEIGRFDLVLLTDVLEHLPDPQTTLLLSREALKPDGAVIVSVPNVAHWSVRLCLLRGKFEYQPSGIMDATHLRWFTSQSIKALLHSAGFEVVQYKATAGLELCDNYGRAPLRWLPAKSRAKFLSLGCRYWPSLFGSQHVLKAKMR